MNVDKTAKQSRAIAALCLVGTVAASGQAVAASEVNPRWAGQRADAVTEWNAHAVEAAVAACLSPGNDPPHESRLYAMTHLAIHNAINAIDRQYRSYGPAIALRPNASPEAAVASAARNVLVHEIQNGPSAFADCIPAGLSTVESAYSAALAAIPDGAPKSQGVWLGEQAAAAIVALRDGDGSDTPLIDEQYPQGTEPGQYRFTPGTPFVFLPGWGGVTPFVLRDATQYRPAPPPSLTGSQYTRDFNEVKRLGGDGVSTPSNRTDDQTEIARFWLESSPSQWNRIARSVTTSRHLDLWENARLFALLNVGLADGYIGSFDTKYHYYFWRPVTAIQLADTDGNPNTAVDPNWTPLEGTPPIPDYDSGHAVEGGIAAQVMKRVFGTDDVRFRVCSLTLPAGSTCADPTPKLRRYTSFTQAANENGLSRILVGFHFRTAVNEGIAHGRKIANRAVDRFLQPVG